MGRNHRINQPAPQCIQTGKGPGLVQTHEARVPNHVGRQNCREPPLEAFFGHETRSRKTPPLKIYGSLGELSIACQCGFSPASVKLMYRGR